MAISCVHSTPTILSQLDRAGLEEKTLRESQYSRYLLLHEDHVRGDCRTLSVLSSPAQGPFHQLHCLHVEEMRRLATRRQQLGTAPNLTASTFLALFVQETRENSAIDLGFPRDPWLSRFELAEVTNPNVQVKSPKPASNGPKCDTACLQGINCLSRHGDFFQADSVCAPFLKLPREVRPRLRKRG